MHLRPLSAALLAASFAFAHSAAAQETGDAVITAARLLDVRSGRYVESPQIVVKDGRIVSVGKAGDTAPAGAKRIDLAGKTLLPGLIDMHVHLDHDPQYGGYNSLQFGDRFWSVIAVPNAERTLRAGFTTVRNVGADAWNDIGLRQAIEEGKVIGPRVVTAGMSFGATGGHCDSTFFPPSMDERSEFNADSPEQARHAVRTLRKYGAQVIKICATGGVFSHGDEPGQQQMTLGEMQAVAEEAHMAHMKVAAHAHGAEGIKAAIRAGIDTIEHASLIDDEGIKLAKQHGTWLSMDIYNTDYTQAEGKKNGVLEDNLRKDREIGEVQRQNFRKAYLAGDKMIFGTDAGVYPHGDNAKQFAVMTRYGMPALEAIRAATVNASQALGRDDVGVVEAGRWADLVAVDGDPLNDVTVLEHVSDVIQGGTHYRGNAAPVSADAAR